MLVIIVIIIIISNIFFFEGFVANVSGIKLLRKRI